MLTWFKSRGDSRRKARELYGAVVTQARNPEFYQSIGVEDTPEGRYELVALHLILVLERLGTEGPNLETLRRETLEAFITDMDDSIRELGAGDMSIPRKVKKAAGGVYERAADYRTALAGPDEQGLIAWVATYALQGKAGRANATALARYVRRSGDLLSGQTASEIADGRVTFPAVLTA